MIGKVLLVDDDVELSSMLSEYIVREGFDVDVVHDGEAGVGAALSGAYSIVVLDVMMPDVGGIEALRRIRGQSRIPVLMLTARGDDVDRIVGLELGADDYVPKPCTPRELVARIRAILRRSQDVQINSDAEGGMLAVGPLVMWPQMRRSHWHGRELGLTSTEYNLLEILARSAGRVVSKAELSEQGLGRPLARFDRSIDVHLSSIRHKLGPRSDGRPWIETVRGLGYQLIRE
ncbi:response regulator transcription factor [Zoogloea sp.]|uniref:response regulator transcription factor n=1 Tax=Zoogloea sp. TaxID=49181 RepID=UPI0026117126|nr:response regulator transcription factor [Zoogloea sp.]